jgi:uncharacterized membrane protein
MATTQPIQDGRKYRRLIYGLIAVGVVSLLAGTAIEQSLVGLVVYALTVLGAFATILFVRYRSSAVLQDEREHRLEQRASHVTFQLFGYLGLFTFIGLFFLDATGQAPLGTTAETLLYAYAVICLTWGAIYTGYRYRV